MTNNKVHIKLKEEEKLINEAKKDLKKFSALYDAYYLPVFRFILSRIEKSADAADITSTVFLKAMSKLNAYKHKGHPFSSWLFMIARNEVNLFYRSKKYERKYFTEYKYVNSMADALDSNTDEEVAILISCLEELNQKDYELVQMKYFEKLKFDEIAEILGGNERNLRVQLHRVRNKLKTKIQQYVGTKAVETIAFLSVLFTTIQFI